MSLFDLYNPEPADDLEEMSARARTTDPETSRAAAKSVDPNHVREVRQRVLACFRAHGAMTQHVLVKRYWARFGECPESSIRTRCKELVEGGFVKDTGKRERLPSRRLAVIWAAKD